MVKRSLNLVVLFCIYFWWLGYRGLLLYVNLPVEYFYSLFRLLAFHIFYLLVNFGFSYLSVINVAFNRSGIFNLFWLCVFCRTVFVGLWLLDMVFCMKHWLAYLGHERFYLVLCSSIIVDLLMASAQSTWTWLNRKKRMPFPPLSLLLYKIATI